MLAGYQIPAAQGSGKRRNCLENRSALRLWRSVTFMNIPKVPMQSETVPASDPTSRVLAGIATLILVYIVACFFGGPQHATQLVVSQETGDQADHGFAPLHPVDGHAATGNESDAHGAAGHHQPGVPGMAWVTPFALLLLAIAVLPLLPVTEHWWESNLHRFYVAMVLGLVTLGYYLIGFNQPLEGHWPAHSVVEPIPDTALQWNLAWTVLANALLHEYIPFIVLLLSHKRALVSLSSHGLIFLFGHRNGGHLRKAFLIMQKADNPTKIEGIEHTVLATGKEIAPL